MDCPKCSGAMEQVNYSRIEIDRCTRCGGLWFQPAELRRLRDDVWMADYIIDTGDKTWGKKLDAVKDYQCPICSETMLHDRDENQKHVTYETCPNGHGSYLDAGELTDLMKKTFWDRFKRSK